MKKIILVLIIVLATGQLFAQTTRPTTLDELLKKMESFEVGADGSITVKGKPVNKINLNKSEPFFCDIVTMDMIDTTKKAKATLIHMDCRDYATEQTNKIMTIQAAFSNKINEVDDYGDQVPHFSMRPPEGAYVSTSFDRNVAETTMREQQ